MPRERSLSIRPGASVKRKKLQDTRFDSYRRTLVCQWLDDITIGTDQTGDILLIMKKRIDMPNSFPTKGHLRRYLQRCGLDDDVIDRFQQHIWNKWRQWLDHARHNYDIPGQPAMRLTEKLKSDVTGNPWDDYPED